MLEYDSEPGPSELGLDDLDLDLAVSMDGLDLDIDYHGHGANAIAARMNLCIVGVVQSVFQFAPRILLFSLLQFLFFSVFGPRFRMALIGFMGLLLLSANNSAQPLLILPFLLFFLASSVLVLTKNALISVHRGIVCATFTVCYIIICQQLLPADHFLSIRGALMIAAMKQISVAFDIEQDNVRPSPSIASLFAFVFHPATLLFGPFVPFPMFAGLNDHNNHHLLIPRYLLLRPLLVVLRHLGLALLFLCLSSCFVDPHSGILPALPWLLHHFLTAQSFRFSHYFVCHFSAATATLGGFSDVQVTKWAAIEWPTSMAQVAIAWNLPLHTFLRKYVYCPAKDRAGNLGAILFTFAISSAFHGFDVQMAAVLHSLGLATFAENRLRDKLSSRFSICVRTKDGCKEECTHRLKKMMLPVVLLRIYFTLANIFLLIYLGAPFYGEGQFEGYSGAHLWQVWADQFFLSGHLLILLTLAIAFLIPSARNDEQIGRYKIKNA